MSADPSVGAMGPAWLNAFADRDDKL